MKVNTLLVPLLATAITLLPSVIAKGMKPESDLIWYHKSYAVLYTAKDEVSVVLFNHITDFSFDSFVSKHTFNENEVVPIGTMRDALNKYI